MRFIQAASELCTTQGAVSQQVKPLALWIRQPLFLRSPRRLVLTPDGLSLAAVLHASFQAIEAALVTLRMPAADAPLLQADGGQALRQRLPLAAGAPAAPGP